MSKDKLRPEKSLWICFRTGVQLPSSPPKHAVSEPAGFGYCVLYNRILQLNSPKSLPCSINSEAIAIAAQLNATCIGESWTPGGTPWYANAIKRLTDKRVDRERDLPGRHLQGNPERTVCREPLPSDSQWFLNRPNIKCSALHAVKSGAEGHFSQLSVFGARLAIQMRLLQF